MRSFERGSGGLVFASILLVSCGTAETHRLDGLGDPCSGSEPCKTDLVCFREVCVPEQGEPFPTGTPGPVGDAGPRTDAGGGPSSSRALFAGSGALIGVFVSPSEIIVVDEVAAHRLDPNGRELSTFTPGRPITTAAADDLYVAIADRATVSTLAYSLELVAEARLVRFCASSVVMPGHRFVCGPDNDWDRVFSTFDLETGTALGESTTYTYNGIPMRPVPGTDSFVTVTVGSSPSDFHLYELGAQSEAVYVNESPYHGDIVATNVYAFNNSPATHLINAAGEILLIRGEDCMSGFGFRANCFVRDGDLGALPVGAMYAAMTDDGAGTIYSIRGARSSRGDPACTPEVACTIERTDYESRTIVERVVYAEETHVILGLVYDVTRHRLLLMVGSPGSDPWAPPVDYELRAIPLTP